MIEAKSAKKGDTHDITVSLQVELLCKEEEIKKVKKSLVELEMEYDAIEADLEN